MDFDVPGGGCLYWEGIKPDKDATPRWSGEFQARSGVFGEGYNGDKTINFKIDEPTAIKIGSFAASANPSPVSVLAVGARIPARRGRALPGLAKAVVNADSGLAAASDLSRWLRRGP